ncbi:glycosyltransferase family 39 protein [Pseudofrankia asymbiotica]|nr:glycosyltransferase family 39 protein [Pseudofrankia asymbiotica]
MGIPAQSTPSDPSAGPAPDAAGTPDHPRHARRARRALGKASGAAGALARRVPAAVLLITALHVALLATYSVIYPTWAGYDEAQHVDMVYGLEHGAGWPGPGDKMISKGVAATSDDFDRGDYADMFLSGGKRRGSPSFAEITPTPRPERGSFDELGGPDPVTDGRLSNQMVQHPPLVYAVGAGLLSALPGSDDWAYDQQVYVLRLLNILLVAPLPLLAWATARRLGLAETAGRGAAVLPLAIPGLTRVGSSFNNDGILMLSASALTFVLAGVLRGDPPGGTGSDNGEAARPRRPKGETRTAVWAGIWLAVALMSKGTALLLPLMVAAAYLVGWLRDRDPDARPAVTEPRRARLRAALASLPWRPAAIALGVGLAAGGWWWVRNYVLYGAVQPNGWGVDPPRREPLLLPDSFWTWLWYFVQTMFNRFWAGLGLFEPPQLTPIAIVSATVVVLAVGLVGLASGLAGPRGRGRGPAPGSEEPAVPAIPAQPTGDAATPAGRRWPGRLRTPAVPAVPAVLLLPAAFAYVTVGQRSWAEYERYTRGIAVQGRYLYLGVVGIAVVAAAGLARLLGRRARWTPMILLVGAVLMQAFALLAICSYYWLGRGVAFTPARIPDAAAAIARWAPFPVGVTWTILAATGALVVAALVVVARSSLRGLPAGPTADDDATSSDDQATPPTVSSADHPARPEPASAAGPEAAVGTR